MLTYPPPPLAKGTHLTDARPSLAEPAGARPSGWPGVTPWLTAAAVAPAAWVAAAQLVAAPDQLETLPALILFAVLFGSVGAAGLLLLSAVSVGALLARLGASPLATGLAVGLSAASLHMAIGLSGRAFESAPDALVAMAIAMGAWMIEAMPLNAALTALVVSGTASGLVYAAGLFGRRALLRRQVLAP